MKKHALLAAVAAAATATALGLTVPATAGSQSDPKPQPADQVRSALASHLGALKATAADSFSVRDVVVDADGSSHVRMDRTVGGLPVLGGDLIVHQTKAGAWSSVTQTLSAPVTVSTKPALSAAKVAKGAFAKADKTRLVVEARKGAPRLAYEFSVSGVQKDGTPSLVVTTVDARTGATLVSEQRIETATGDGQSLYSGTVTLQTTPVTGGYELRDPTRGNGWVTDLNNQTDTIWCQLLGIGCKSGTIFKDADNHWGNGTTSDRASAAVDAAYGASMTWDYYKNVHGRNGIFNDGKGVRSRVHYGTNYVNAFWDGTQMTYGDGDNVVAGPLVSLDVAGHEMSHGVTSATANLTYSGESGGLNEATSDIFGTAVEWNSANGNDPGDYLIGEEIVKDRVALRYMDRPSRDGNSADCYSSTVGNLDVHYSSGVANHFAFLLAEGSGARTINGVSYNSPTCNGSTLASGIGIAKVGKIWYRALTTGMTTNTNYAGARTATLNAASALYGASSPERAAVAAAWSAVNVN